MADPVLIEASARPAPVMGGTKTLNGSTSQLVKGVDGMLAGIFVASASNTPTIKLWDSTAASGTVLINTFVPSPGWYAMPFRFSTGLYITVGGTIDYTISYS